MGENIEPYQYVNSIVDYSTLTRYEDSQELQQDRELYED